MIKLRLDKKLDYSNTPIIMGVVNMTPDSFSDGGDYNSLQEGFDRAKRFIDDGAKIIDIGGESTRPGYEMISDEEEISRIIPLIEKLSKETEAIISVDTYKSKVAEEALKAGAHIVNDIWGLQYDENMASVCVKYDAYVIVMHNAKEKDENRDIVKHAFDFFDKSIKIAEKSGIKSANICLDPGIGFAKTHEQNLSMMRSLARFSDIGYPILLGISRKSMIGNILGNTVDERLAGTIAANMFGYFNGADIIRVHDVKAHYDAFKVFNSF